MTTIDGLSVHEKAAAVIADLAVLIEATPGELTRLEEYLKDPGAGKDAAGRSAAAQSDHRNLKAMHPHFVAAYVSLTAVRS